VYQESEIVDLLMVVFLTPIMYAAFRNLVLPGKRWFVFGYVAMLAGYVFTVVEGYYAPDVFNLLEHCSYALAGIGFAGGAWNLLVDARARRSA
jgi:phosphoglycerol transferase MdoB-like AlkP superfamily enzyme